MADANDTVAAEASGNDAHRQPTPAQIKRWRKYLANERAEAAVYRELAASKTGEEREILLSVAEAESRHEEHWRQKLGMQVGLPQPAPLSTRILAFMAKHFGSVFTLALMQTAEQRSPYEKDLDATDQMTADEKIHAEVVRGLAQRGREQMSGNFRAAVFGMNDGLVSNLALVLGVVGSGASHNFALMAGVSGLLAGALSMGAGEYVSVSSQRELLEASTPDPEAHTVIPQLDVNANELELVYRARGMSQEEAAAKAHKELAAVQKAGSVSDASLLTPSHQAPGGAGDSADVVGSGLAAAISSFLFFAGGAAVPILPLLIPGLGLTTAAIISCVLVGLCLMLTGAVVGILSGAPLLGRALRQLAIGLGAAAVTYGLGSLFG